MQWADRAIVLSARKFDEHGAIVRVLTQQHGFHGGVARHARSSRQRGIFEPGNIIEAQWSARLAEHLGTLKGELVTPIAALVMQDALLLSALQSATSLLEATLHERDPLPALYERMQDFALRLMTGHHWEASYVALEISLLQYLGFGLDLTRCAATGAFEDLGFVSPKSGRAVSEAAAAPYRDRMLRLPAFMLQTKADSGVEPKEILDGLTLVGYFLASRVFAPQEKTLPPARDYFLNAFIAHHSLEPAG